MQYAVEARMFNNGKTVVRVRPAWMYEAEGRIETDGCDIWIDLFDTRREAEQFAGSIEMHKKDAPVEA